MEEADKVWVMIRMVGGWVFLLVLAHPGRKNVVINLHTEKFSQRKIANILVLGVSQSCVCKVLKRIKIEILLKMYLWVGIHQRLALEEIDGSSTYKVSQKTDFNWNYKYCEWMATTDYFSQNCQASFKMWGFYETKDSEANCDHWC